MSLPRTWVVIRKQKLKQQPDPALRRWIAACQRCSRACSSLQWDVVIRWADDHPGHCSAPFAAFSRIQIPNVQMPPLFPPDLLARMSNRAIL